MSNETISSHASTGPATDAPGTSSLWSSLSTSPESRILLTIQIGLHIFPRTLPLAYVPNADGTTG